MIKSPSLMRPAITLAGRVKGKALLFLLRTGSCHTSSVNMLIQAPCVGIYEPQKCGRRYYSTSAVSGSLLRCGIFVVSVAEIMSLMGSFLPPRVSGSPQERTFGQSPRL